MKKLLVLCGMLVFLFSFSFSAQAQDKVDFGAFTCADLIKDASNQEAMAILLTWIDGYLSGISGDTVFNAAEFPAFAEKLAENCAADGNENKKVLDAAKEVGIAK